MPKTHFYFAIAVSLLSLVLGLAIAQIHQAGWGLLAIGGFLAGLAVLTKLFSQLTGDKPDQAKVASAYHSGEVSHV